MTIRTTSRKVTFSRPFTLRDLAGIQPAGTYEIETDEEPIGDHSLLAYHRIATTIRLQRNGEVQIVRIDPIDLEASLLRDAGLTVVPDAV